MKELNSQDGFLEGYSTFDRLAAEIGNKWPRNGFTFQSLTGEETRYTFPELEKETAARAARLQGLGLQKGDRLALAVIEPEGFVLTLLAALRIGVISVPLSFPISAADLRFYKSRIGRILNTAGAKLLMASPRLFKILSPMVDDIPCLSNVLDVDAVQWNGGTGTPDYPVITPDDIAYLQFTSGSTSDPRGVIVTHKSLLANTIGINSPHGLGIDPNRDIGLSWLPLYHDMGLVGFVFAPILRGSSAVFMPTLRFLRRPSIWMETMHRHRATVSFGPNFSFWLSVQKATDEELNHWDLSCVRVLGCGGEPINPTIIREFIRLFHERTGLPRTAFCTSYGLAENTLAVSLASWQQELKSIRVDAASFRNQGIIKKAHAGQPALEFVSCGTPLPDHEVIIAGPDGLPLPEGRQGHILVRGPSVCPGYYENPGLTAETFRNCTLHTGDLGFLQDGEVYVTGRFKDLIIYNGRNIHPHEIEWAAEQVEGVREGHTVAFSVEGEETEKIVVVLETREKNHESIITQVKTTVQSKLSLPLYDVVCVRPSTVPKTSSGKVKRMKTRQQYLDGLFSGT